MKHPEGRKFYLAIHRRGLVDSVVSSKVKPRGWYKDFGNVRTVLEMIIEEDGDFPRAERIREVDSSLCPAIYNHHGDLNEVRRKMGYEEGSLTHTRRSRRNFNWRGMSDDELEQYYHNNFAGQDKATLRKDPEGKSLLGALRRRGLEGVVPNSRKDMGYYRDVNNVLAELREIAEANGGELPIPRRISELNSSLHSQIYRYHGGYEAVVSLMQED